MQPLRNNLRSCVDFKCGAFAQFFKADLATYMALRSFRTFNRVSPIYLVSDGGDDFSELARMFGCEYVYESLNNGTARSRHARTDQYIWLSRIQKACATGLVEADWIVLLEPDVECFKPPTSTPQYPLSGPGDGPSWSDPLRRFFHHEFGARVRPGGLGCNYTGCGGSIFNRRIFLDCYDMTLPEMFQQASVLDDRISTAEDATLTFLFHANGFDTGRWEDFARSHERHDGQVAFVHGNKQHYGKLLAIPSQEAFLPSRPRRSPSTSSG